MLTAERLREILDYDPETGIFRYKVRPSTRVHVGDIAGSENNGGYINIRIKPKSFKAHRLAWLYIYGNWPEKHLDHIDGNTLNNKINNLREASRYQNLANAKIHKDNKSGFKGVVLSGRKFIARILINREKMHLGRYTTPEAAHAAYCLAAYLYKGEFARFQ